jgi:hypothetical protein
MIHVVGAACPESGDQNRPPNDDLVLLFTSLLTIPLSRQRFLYAALFARFQVEGMTFYLFDDVFLLDLALKPAQCIFKRLAFLHANLCQRNTPPDDPNWALTDYRMETAFCHPPPQRPAVEGRQHAPVARFLEQIASGQIRISGLRKTKRQPFC